MGRGELLDGHIEKGLILSGLLFADACAPRVECLIPLEEQNDLGIIGNFLGKLRMLSEIPIKLHPQQAVSFFISIHGSSPSKNFVLYVSQFRSISSSAKVRLSAYESLKRFFFLLSVYIVTVYVGKVMSAIITYHRLPDATYIHFRMDYKIHHLAPFGLVDVPFTRVFS
jgi:hypothetical protein